MECGIVYNDDGLLLGRHMKLRVALAGGGGYRLAACGIERFLKSARGMSSF